MSSIFGIRKRITIVTGHFGSGKSEVAVNIALAAKKAGADTALVDMDIVNPFFRSADAAEILRANGIKAIVPTYANSNVDVPVIPGEINSVFENSTVHAVLDVGGDDLGAKAVASYRDSIIKEDYDMLMVINTAREFTKDARSICEMMYEIEMSAGIRVTGIINNTNVLQYTTEDTIREGEGIIREAIQMYGRSELEIVGTAFMSKYAHAENFENAIIMDKYIKLPFDYE